MFNNLFNSIDLKGLHLKNRIIFPAMGTKMAEEDGNVSQQIIDYQVARVKGGCGLNMSEVCSVHKASAPKGFLAIHSDSLIESHKKFTEAIHNAGGKCGVQLWQGSLASSLDPSAEILVADDFKYGKYTIPKISIEKIKEVVNSFGEAARRSVEAGYDCIGFHCGHNYLPHSFLTAGMNNRDDEYGGSLEDRAKFPLECIRAIRKNIPDDMPLIMRVDAHDDYFKNGLTIEDIIKFCLMAKEAGVDALDISRGNMITPGLKYEVPPIDIPNGFNVENAARIKKETGMVTIAVGRINTPKLADEIIAEGKADMVVVGRGQLADPEFCNKAKDGKLDEIVYCVGCNQGCYDGFTDPNVPFITCLRNPLLGHESDDFISKPTEKKKVLVAGAGVGGLEVACLLKEKGHDVVVYESSDHTGGQFLTAGKAPRKNEMLLAAQSYEKKAERLGIEIHLNTPVNAELIGKEMPDEVVAAIGAVPIKIPVDGYDNDNVFSSHDVLNGKSVPFGKCVVIGGGLVGVETAEFIKENLDLDVTIVEMNDEVAKDLGAIRKICVMESLSKSNIKSETSARLTRIGDGFIAVDRDGEEEYILADSVVMAIGAKAKAHDEIKNECEKLSIPCHVIGDTKRARRAINSIREAYEVAREI